MIDTEALFKVSYGLFVVCSGDSNKANGFISNTVFQITSSPAKFAASCNKDNYTAEFIIRHRAFSVSVLGQDASPDLFGIFGYKTGRDYDKLAGQAVKYGVTGVPVVTGECIAYLEFRLVETIDAGTHWLFIGELAESVVLDDQQKPMTYQYYRDVRKGRAPKNAPTYIEKEAPAAKAGAAPARKYQCPACGYIYDESVESVRFESLADDWICPICGTPKGDFFEMIN
jgi:flavin reductase (DIM6/NTAB) family NADH-FMN oxidoreductase RutF/rubredoxin